MKRLTASEVRKNWFRVLDEVAAGEVVVLERKGQRIVLRREDKKTAKSKQQVPDYSRLLRVPDADQADRWSWDWQGPGQDLMLISQKSSDYSARYPFSDLACAWVKSTQRFSLAGYISPLGRLSDIAA